MHSNKNYDMNLNMKRIVPDLVCVALFALIAFAYFCPAVLDGRQLNQHDHIAAGALTVESDAYKQSHDGETPRWQNSIFCGMPTYQISPTYDSTKCMSFLEKVYRLWLPNYVFYIFISMLGFYILLRAFDFRQWMAALGAIVWAFSSYFFIIIAAGHIWKVWTLAYIPPTIAGMVICYRNRRYLIGCAVTAFFASLQIASNHIQMSYYFLIPEILMVIAFLISSIRERKMVPFLKASASVLAAAVIAIGLNASNLYHTYEYSKESMRGKSELVKAGSTANQTDSGLERDYITNWSYGLSETWTLLVPDMKGGASVPLSDSKIAMNNADKSINPEYFDRVGQYWGDQPGTSGPVYIGALVCMLFLLGMWLIPNRNPLKWAFFAATILSVLLSWGKNFMPFTDFFIDNVPMYAKFRTVASILVVAEFTMPLIAMMGLREFVERCADKERRGRALQAMMWCTIITAGICICFAFNPLMLGDGVSLAEKNAYADAVSSGNMDAATMQMITDSLAKMRGAMLASDAKRSCLIIILGAVAMFWYYRKIKGADETDITKYGSLCCIVLLIICLADMWMVNKRYLNDGMFEVPVTAASYRNTQADDIILSESGTGRNYRVYDATVSTFNDNTAAHNFSSIGGYHAAKMRRYQELVEAHIIPEVSHGMGILCTQLLMPDSVRIYPVLPEAETDSLIPVLNMLNTQWFILGDPTQPVPVKNPAAYGNAWFVNETAFVDNANEELDMLGKVSPRNTAVINKVFQSQLKNVADMKVDTAACIRQTSLTCDEIVYEADSKYGGLAVFSEIYYPGWAATVDGEPADIVRADYVLRAMEIPAGHHEIVMTFHPKSVAATETVAYISFAMLILMACAAILMELKKKKQD